MNPSLLRQFLYKVSLTWLNVRVVFAYSQSQSDVEVGWTLIVRRVNKTIENKVKTNTIFSFKSLYKLSHPKLVSTDLKFRSRQWTGDKFKLIQWVEETRSQKSSFYSDYPYEWGFPLPFLIYLLLIHRESYRVTFVVLSRMRETHSPYDL